MDNKINLLAPEVIQQIAAGEVVERPASAVKELLENSLDAQAGQIEITLVQGGKRLIRVCDDGIGMGPQDLEMAVLRHATSKLTRSEDLFTIRSLGFRGEALSSIAAVSRMTITTRTADNPAAAKIVAEGGQIGPVTQCGAPIGTTVEVEDLFYNVPARAKFLRTAATELSVIARLISQQSLAYLPVRIKLTHQTRELLNLPKAAHLTDRLALVYGLEFAENLLPVEHISGDFTLRGYLTRPQYSLAGREHQVCFINRRLVRDKLISQAIYQSYGHAVPADRQPGWVLFLEIPTAEVDVNVHPAKTEVRFAQPQFIRQLVSQGVAQALGSLNAAPRIFAPAAPPSGEAGTSPEASYQQRVQQALIDFTESAMPRREFTPAGAAHSPKAQEDDRPNAFIAALTPIGQFQNSFILCQSQKELIIIDQHAAHEKVLFEGLLDKLKRRAVQIQPLLIPLPLELTAAEEQTAAQHAELLNRAGFELAPFGGRTHVLRSGPADIPVEELPAAVKNVLEGLSHTDLTDSLDNLYHTMAAGMACHAAIKVNQRLEPQEIAHLLKQLAGLKQPLACPHGRPIILRYSLDELYKYFLRGSPPQ